MLARTEKLIDLIWSPLKENEFVAFDNDIYLYRIVNKNSTNSLQGCRNLLNQQINTIFLNNLFFYLKQNH